MVRRLCWVVVMLVAANAVAQVSFHTTVAAPDGTALATEVYLPAPIGSWPVILQRTPYGRDGLRDACLVFNLLGYACVAQDTRGRFGSQGQDTAFRDDGPDGRATVTWVASQSWCNGRVGTFGGSALGITQYALAPGAPRALLCLMPLVATADFYHHAAFQGGALREALVHNWLAGQGNLPAYEEIRAHRLWDEWWSEAAILPHVGDAHAAGLHIGGWYDIFSQGTIDAFAALQHRGGDGAQGAQYLIMGPWTHGGVGGRQAGELTYPANAVLDLVDLLVSWFGHWLKRSDSGVEEWPVVRVYLMGAVGESGAPGNAWLSMADWPPPSRDTALFLAAPAQLTAALPSAGEVGLDIDPTSPVPTLGGAELYPDLEVDGRPMGAGPYDQRPIEARADVLEFTSERLSTPLVVMGRLRAQVWVRPDTVDLDLAVRLTDVYPDGRSMLVADGVQRARSRCGDDRECLVIPGEPVELVVDLWSTAMAFNAGHRLRLTVSGSNTPRFEVNPNDGTLPPGGGAAVAHPVILVGGETPSRLVLPVASGVGWPRRRLPPPGSP